MTTHVFISLFIQIVISIFLFFRFCSRIVNKRILEGFGIMFVATIANTIFAMWSLLFSRTEMSLFSRIEIMIAIVSIELFVLGLMGVSYKVLCRNNAMGKIIDGKVVFPDENGTYKQSTFERSKI